METEVINLDEYSRIMQLLDLNPSLASVRNEIIRIYSMERFRFRRMKFQH